MSKGLIKASDLNKIIRSAPAEIKDELNDKQKAFVQAYCYNWKRREAYMKVYDVKDGNVADVCASQLLSNPKIQRYLDYCRNHVEEMVNVSKAMMVAESLKIATSNIARYHDNWITLKEFNEISDDDKAAIQSIESETRTEVKDGLPVKIDFVKIKLYNKQASIDSVNKMLGYNAKEVLDINVSRNDMAEVPTEELLKRAKSIKVIQE
jgi:phage terminase small subunit